MTHIVDIAFNRAKVTMLSLAVLIFVGVTSYITLPREADPDVPFPIILVTVPLPGVSPEDAERLLIRPTEIELQTIEGLVEMDSTGFEGVARIVLEFEVTADLDKALTDVREAVDTARSEYPEDALEPIVQEFNAQRQFPIVSVIMSGDAPERALYQAAVQLEDRLRTVNGVLDAELVGARDEILEIIIDPDTLAAYGLSELEVANAFQTNNALVTAGSTRFADGTYAVKIPGLVKTLNDASAIPIRTDGTQVITLGDVAELRRTFEDPEGLVRFNGAQAIAVDVNKRSGSNIVEVTEAVKAATLDLAATWPETIEVTFIGDQSYFVNDILTGLTASILLAVLLVMIVVVAALGFRSAIMVGIAIPSSFLIGMFLISVFGFTLNMMVMFAMVLSVGMLVDGAIVIVEYADRRMLEGADRRTAYADASKRMFWPIVASTATTLAAFVPFLFWQDVPGKFMRFLPLTLIFVLSASLVVALIFLPLLGSYFGLPESWKRRFGLTGKTNKEAKTNIDNIDPTTLPGITGTYTRFIKWLIRKPIAAICVALVVVFTSMTAFSAASPEVEFFIKADSEQVYIQVHGRGNLSEEEKLAVAMEVSDRIQYHSAIEHIYTQTGIGLSRRNNTPNETIAQLTIDLTPYEEREHSLLILDEFRELTADVPGVVLEVGQPEAGPPVGKDVQVEITSEDNAASLRAAKLIREFLETSMHTINGKEVFSFMDIEDTQSLPGVQWKLEVDREQAGRFGVSVREIGSLVQLVTDGLLIDKYRPDDSKEELDVRIRYPVEDRTLSNMDRMMIQTREGPLPLSNFVRRVPEPQVDRVVRRDGRRIMEVKANGNINVKGHEISQDVAISIMQEWLDSGVLEEAVGPGVNARLIGSTEERDEAGTFFLGAMAAAMFMIGFILLLQFNSFYHAALTLSAVVLSVFGVLLGIAISGQYISVIMTGVGIVALAGIVVNNNIVLIDTYRHLRQTGLTIEEAILRTAAQRARPVLLTTITTIMGLLPMVFEINVDFTTGVIGIGSATSDWWVLLSSAVVYGLAFSTLLTLVLTPVLLAAPVVLPMNLKNGVLEIYYWLSGKEQKRRELQDSLNKAPVSVFDERPEDYPRAAE
jgi:multidrug efflux pump